MKRPPGFEQQTGASRLNAAPSKPERGRSGRPAGEGGAGRATPPADLGPAWWNRPGPQPDGAPDGVADAVRAAPRGRPERGPGNTSRLADDALRAAQRERRRYEKGEMRRFTRRTRHRRTVILVSLGVVAAIVLGVIALAFSPLFSLRTIEVDGASDIGTQRVEWALRGQLGRPLALVGASDVESVLSRFPRVRTFSIETLPPGTLIVRIVERVPIGVIQNGSTYQTVDAARVALASASVRPAGLPLIHVAPARGTSRAEVFSAVAEVLSSLPASVLSKVDTITASTPDDVSFTLGSSGPTVVWGTSADSNLKAADLSRLLALPEAEGVTEFDVSAPYSVVMR